MTEQSQSEGPAKRRLLLTDKTLAGIDGYDLYHRIAKVIVQKIKEAEKAGDKSTQDTWDWWLKTLQRVEHQATLPYARDITLANADTCRRASKLAEADGNHEAAGFYKVMAGFWDDMRAQIIQTDQLNVSFPQEMLQAREESVIMVGLTDREYARQEAWDKKVSEVRANYIPAPFRNTSSGADLQPGASSMKASTLLERLETTALDKSKWFSDRKNWNAAKNWTDMAEMVREWQEKCPPSLSALAFCEGMAARDKEFDEMQVGDYVGYARNWYRDIIRDLKAGKEPHLDWNMNLAVELQLAGRPRLPEIDYSKGDFGRQLLGSILQGAIQGVVERLTEPRNRAEDRGAPEQARAVASRPSASNPPQQAAASSASNRNERKSNSQNEIRTNRPAVAIHPSGGNQRTSTTSSAALQKLNSNWQKTGQVTLDTNFIMDYYRKGGQVDGFSNYSTGSTGYNLLQHNLNSVGNSGAPGAGFVAQLGAGAGFASYGARALRLGGSH